MDLVSYINVFIHLYVYVAIMVKEWEAMDLGGQNMDGVGELSAVENQRHCTLIK